MSYNGDGCWLARFSAEPCDGRLRECHLITKQVLKQEFRKGAVWIDGRWQPTVEARFIPEDEARHLPRRTLKQLQEDPRAWVWGCGGPMGIGGHHALLDTHPHDSKRIQIPRALLPAGAREYAAELGLDWWILRHYH